MWIGYFCAYQQIISVTPNGLFEKQHFDEKNLPSMGKFFWSINFDTIETAEVQGKLPAALKVFLEKLCELIDLFNWT